MGAVLLFFLIYGYQFIDFWISMILFMIDNRKQAVVINELNSNRIPVSSDVLQGSILRPLLFLEKHQRRSDQEKGYSESQVLQKDLLSLEQWEKMRHMNFNPSKYQVLHVIRLKTPTETKYLHDIEMDSVSTATI